MKILGTFLSAILLVSLTPAAMAASPVKTSKLYAFKGKYHGTVNYGGVATGTTTGSISASKKKEVGNVTLNSVLSLGGSTAPLTETISIQKKTASYLIQIAGTTGTGSGSASVSKNTITYSVPFSASGLNYVVNGTIRRTKKGLTVVETISGNVAFTITYTLKRSGK